MCAVKQMVKSDGRRDASCKSAVRILLLGDPGVGKTSLILSLVSEEFPDDVPCRAEEITIPADVTPERVPTHIVDYSAQEQDQQMLVKEIHQADVICIVYSVDEEDTIDNITTYWLPLIREQLGDEHRTPVVLVGNKTDLTDYGSLDMVFPIMSEFAEVESCVQCSAKTLRNISEMFYYAQKAVLHPTSPLYVMERQNLTDRCRNALIRIFKISDTDNDGILNDTELNRFQEVCFNSPLQPQALEDVKTIVSQNLSDGVCNDGLTLDGFIFLHTLFIQRGRHETTWTVLRKFGYDDNLQLHKEYMNPYLRVPPGSTTELTHQGYKFLTEIFQKYDKDRDNHLNEQELEDLFGTCPFLPWGPDVYNTVPGNNDGLLSYKSYLAQWTLQTYLDVGRTMELLAYLGYNVHETNQLSAIQITREKNLDLQKRQTSRNVFKCHVIGPKNAGKSTFLQGLLGRDFNRQKELDPSQMSRYAINTVQVYGQEKYLLVHEIDVLGMGESLTSWETQCDVVCLMYDISHPRSFEYIAKNYLKHFHDSKIPVLIVANKCDQPEMEQKFTLQPEQFCKHYKLAPPQTFTAIVGRGSTTLKREVFVKLATMAAYPNLKSMVHMLLVRPSPSWLSENIRYLKNQFGIESSWLKTTFGIAAIAVVSIFAVRAYKHSSVGLRGSR